MVVHSFYLFCMTITLVFISGWLALLVETIIEKLDKEPNDKTWDIVFAVAMFILSWVFWIISKSITIFAVGTIVAIFIMGKTLLYKKEKKTKKKSKI